MQSYEQIFESSKHFGKNFAFYSETPREARSLSFHAFPGSVSTALEGCVYSGLAGANVATFFEPANPAAIFFRKFFKSAFYTYYNKKNDKQNARSYMKMEKQQQTQSALDRFLLAIPRVMAGKVSIFIYLFLFFYLVIFALVCLLVPALKGLAPTADAQLVLGNYTNVLSALGASIAAGSGVAIHTKVKAIREGHQKLQDSIDQLHKKLDKLEKEKKQEGK